MKFSIRDLLLVEVLFGLFSGCSPATFRGTSSNPVLGAPSATADKGEIIASVAPSTAGSRIEVLDRKRAQLLWQSDGLNIDTNPVMSSDGRLLFFERRNDMSHLLMEVALSTGGEPRPISDQHDTILDVSPSGKWLIVSRHQPGQGLSGNTDDIVLVKADTASTARERYGAGARFLNDDEVLFVPYNGDQIRRKHCDKSRNEFVCDGVLPVISVDKKRFLCVENISNDERPWVVYSTEGKLLGRLGPAYSPVFSSTGNEVIYVPKELNGELWRWDIATDKKSLVGSVGYVSQMRSSPLGVLFFVNEGTSSMATAVVDESKWTVQLVPFSQAKPLRDDER